MIDHVKTGLAVVGTVIGVWGFGAGFGRAEVVRVEADTRVNTRRLDIVEEVQSDMREEQKAIREDVKVIRQAVENAR